MIWIVLQITKSPESRITYIVAQDGNKRIRLIAVHMTPDELQTGSHWGGIPLLHGRKTNPVSPYAAAESINQAFICPLNDYVVPGVVDEVADGKSLSGEQVFTLHQLNRSCRSGRSIFTTSNIRCRFSDRYISSFNTSMREYFLPNCSIPVTVVPISKLSSFIAFSKHFHLVAIGLKQTRRSIPTRLTSFFNVPEDILPSLANQTGSLQMASLR